MSDDQRDPWTVTPDAFSRDGSTPDQARFLLTYAVLAPSSHNSQPWQFRVGEHHIDLLGDPGRRLHVVDPDGRELMISCGAALFNLRLALAHFGMPHSVDTLPDQTEPDLLARICLDHGDLAALPAELFPALTKRRTNRAAYSAEAVPAATIAGLRAAAEAEGAWFQELSDDRTREEVADLVMAGDRTQWANPHFRRELVSWMHPDRTRSRDGMPGYAFQEPELESLVAPLLIRTFDLGNGRAAADRKLATGSPVLAVLGTGDDRPAAWLHAGQALARIFLQATADGLSISFLNQPIEVPELRPRLGALTGHAGYPQMLMRVGIGPAGPHTPRRPVAEVTRPASG